MIKKYKILIGLVVVFLCVSATNQQYVLVCESSSSYAYHTHYCSGLGRCTHNVVKVTQEQAQKMGKKPCKFCYK